MSGEPDKNQAPAVVDDGEFVEEEEDEGDVAAQLLKNPKVLAALQGTLAAGDDSPAAYVESLPKVVKRRIKALKNLQLKATHIEAQFYEEVHTLELKYHQLYLPLYEQRHKVTSGTYEPTDAECEFPLDDDLSQELEEKAKIGDNELGLPQRPHNMDENTKGIPDFWLMVLKNADLLANMIEPPDEPVLKHLQDIKVVFTEEKPMDFTLEFHFTPNEFFTNPVLTKEYVMRSTPDEKDPFSFEGPEIYKCKGCKIDWKQGKDVTVKTVKKKQKHKSRGTVRTITKTVKSDSFFNFFSPPAVPDDPDAELDEETQDQLTVDFETGHYFRERLVPRAVLFYTGEAGDEDFDEDEEEEEEEEGSESDGE